MSKNQTTVFLPAVPKTAESFRNFIWDLAVNLNISIESQSTDCVILRNEFAEDEFIRYTPAPGVSAPGLNEPIPIWDGKKFITAARRKDNVYEVIHD